MASYQGIAKSLRTGFDTLSELPSAYFSIVTLWVCLELGAVYVLCMCVRVLFSWHIAGYMIQSQHCRCVVSCTPCVRLLSFCFLYIVVRGVDTLMPQGALLAPSRYLCV